jgi:hypothetical protein
MFEPNIPNIVDGDEPIITLGGGAGPIIVGEDADEYINDFLGNNDDNNNNNDDCDPGV